MRYFNFLLVLVLVFSFTAFVSADNANAKWNTFSQNLVKSLTSENDGLKESAMQLIVEYADHVWVHEAAFNIYNIYKTHESQKMRHLALITLYKIKNDWFMNELIEDIKTETSPVLRSQMISMVKEYYKNKSNDKTKYDVASQ